MIRCTMAAFGRYIGEPVRLGIHHLAMEELLSVEAAIDNINEFQQAAQHPSVRRRHEPRGRGMKSCTAFLHEEIRQDPTNVLPDMPEWHQEGAALPSDIGAASLVVEVQ